MILDDIIAHKKEELVASKERISLSELENKVKDVPKPIDVIDRHNNMSGVKIIAEIKKASPSKGIIREDFDHVNIAKSYEEAGAFALSVLTDEKYFQGKLSYLNDIKKVVSIPLLRKDFTIDPYQIYEARSYGADIILLIVSALELSQIKEFRQVAESLGMNAIVEVHSEVELETALKAESNIIGINNRDLKTFNVSLKVSKRLSSLVPEGKIVIAESGISSRQDIDELLDSGVETFLVGESFMRADKPGEKLKALL